MWSCTSAHTCNRDLTHVWGRWGGGSGTLNLLRGKNGFSAALMKCTARQHSTTLELFKTVHPRNPRSCRAVLTSPANPRAGQSRAEQPLSFGRGHGASCTPKTRITQLQTATPPALQNYDAQRRVREVMGGRGRLLCLGGSASRLLLEASWSLQVAKRVPVSVPKGKVAQQPQATAKGP